MKTGQNAQGSNYIDSLYLLMLAHRRPSLEVFQLQNLEYGVGLDA